MAAAARYQSVEDDFIRDHWQAMTDRDMARELGRTETAITSRRANLRLLRTTDRPKHPSMRPWSAVDDDALRAMFAAGMSDDDMATALRRTVQSIGQRRSSLRLLRKQRPEYLPEGGLWSAEDDRILEWMFEHGWTDSRIGEAMDRTACAVKDRRQTLSLRRAPRS